MTFWSQYGAIAYVIISIKPRLMDVMILSLVFERLSAIEFDMQYWNSMAFTDSVGALIGEPFCFWGELPAF